MTTRSILPTLAALWATVAVTSCSVVGSAPMVQYAMLPGSAPTAFDVLGCDTKLGSYSLPKSLLHVTVMTPAVDKGFYMIGVAADKKVPDNRYTFCLDHLANGFADDAVRVFKDKVEVATAASGNTRATYAANKNVTTPFLQLIASNAVDQSASIVRKIIKAAFILISGNPDFEGARFSIEGADRGDVVRDLTFDPFDQHELAEINESIAPLGFCVILSDYSYDVNAIAVARYCDNPQKAVQQHPSPHAQSVARQRYLVPKPKSGIFYRPRAKYPVSVYAKADPGGRDPWRLASMQYFAFENISPIISVGVGRAAFAARRTGLVFDDGVLTNVCIAKGSEAAGFINIPLDIIYGVIALPTQTIKATINSSTTRQALLTAQDDLINAQDAYVDYLKDTANQGTAQIQGSDNAAPIKLGPPTGSDKPIGVPGPPSEDQEPADHGTELNGNTNSLVEAGILQDICPELQAANVGTVFNDTASDPDDGAKF